MTTYAGTNEFEGATFVKASFKGATLRFSDLSGVTMRSVDVDGLDIDDKQMARVEAIILSMTPHERRVPHLINGPRRRRIAAGSGSSIDDVNKLLAARKQMQKMMKQFGKGKMPTLPDRKSTRLNSSHT